MLATRQKFGKFVLLEPMDSSSLGSETRAAKLGPGGLEKIVTVLQLSPSLSANAEAARSLMEQAKVAAQLQSPNIVKIYGIGKVDSVYYVSYEFVEGKSLKEVFNRCRREQFPLSVDHSLLIASKICSALEYAHSRRSAAGPRYFHGLLTPASVVVSYEGEVRVRSFGYWPSRLREAGVLSEEDTRYLAPEQQAGGAGETRSDIFAVGAILLELLTGKPLPRRGQDLAAQIDQARMWSPAAEDDSLPPPIKQILQRSLAQNPAERYAEVQEMRKAIDILLFSGDFTPTTFNLAFFMHSLFREDIERESKVFKEEKERSYQDFLSDDAVRSVPAAVAATDSATAAPTSSGGGISAGGPPPPGEAAITAPAPGQGPGVAPVATPAAASAAAAVPLSSAAASAAEAVPVFPGPGAALRQEPALPHGYSPTVPHGPSPVAPHVFEPVYGAAAHPELAPSATAKDAASSFTFHKAPASRSRAPLLAGAAGLMALAAVGYYFGLGPGTRFWRPPAPPPAPSTPTPEAAAVARVKELEDKLAAVEAEKAAAEAKAAEEARKKVEAQAAARDRKADPIAPQKAQDDARKNAQAEQERKLQEERRRLEEARAAEEARLAEERKAEEAARVAAAATPSPASLPASPASAPVSPGALVDLSDPGVVSPVVERELPLKYPPIALRQKVEGTVELNVLVDEKGAVTDAQVVSGAGGRAGLNEAAIESVKKRRYRPALKDGVPVKVWIRVRVKFELPG